MSAIKAGDVVKVTNKGATYPTYRTMFDLMGGKSLGFEFTNGNVSREEGEYIVLATRNNSHDDTTIALIHNNNKDAFLVGAQGLKVVE